jgi:hypothetical protein
MRLSSIVVMLVACGSIAFADSKPAPAPPAPDLVFTWSEGEMSMDMSMWTTTIMVTGTKLHYTRSYAGRNGGMPDTNPVDLDAIVKDPKKVAAALTALDKVKVKKTKPATREQQMQMRTGCIRRGKAERCAWASGTDPDPAELQAIVAVRDALLDDVKLPDAL